MTRYNKFLVALATAIAQVIALGLVDPDVAQWLTVVLAFFGALGVFAIPNVPPRDEAPDPTISEQHV